VLSCGIVSATAIPLPGGLGATEAGLFTGLILFGKVNASHALPIVIIYRLITYWLSAVVGAAAFELANLRGYL